MTLWVVNWRIFNLYQSRTEELQFKDFNPSETPIVQRLFAASSSRSGGSFSPAVLGLLESESDSFDRGPAFVDPTTCKSWIFTLPRLSILGRPSILPFLPPCLGAEDLPSLLPFTPSLAPLLSSMLGSPITGLLICSFLWVSSCSLRSCSFCKYSASIEFLLISSRSCVLNLSMFPSCSFLMQTKYLLSLRSW